MTRMCSCEKQRAIYRITNEACHERYPHLAGSAKTDQCPVTLARVDKERIPISLCPLTARPIEPIVLYAVQDG